MRTITVYSTQGKQMASIVTDVATWGELKPLVKKEGYDLSSLKASENINRTTLEHIDAVLPASDFTLFLRPEKTKSGLEVANLSFKELRELVKQYKDTPGFLDHINAKGNYTRLSTDELRNTLATWNAKATGTEWTETVGDSPEPASEEKLDILSAAEAALALFKRIFDAVEDDNLADRAEFIIDETQGFITDFKDILVDTENREKAEEEARKKAEDEKLAKEKAEAEAARKAKLDVLAKEADDFAKGL